MNTLHPNGTSNNPLSDANTVNKFHHGHNEFKPHKCLIALSLLP